MNPATVYLSKHLTLQQATTCRPGFINQPTDRQLEALKFWGVNVYDPICEHFGLHVFTHSIFRDDAYNKAIGGDPHSDHRCPLELAHVPAAGDLDLDGNKTLTNKMLFDWAVRNLKFKQIIWEKGTKENPDWIHIANADGDNQGRITRCLVEDGKTKYIPFDLYKIAS